MKKNIRLLIIALAILFVIPNVNAREFTIEDTNFTIEGIKINLYTMTYDNGDIKRTDLEKYVSRQPAKTINVDISKLSYHPKYKTISVNASTDEWTVKKHQLIDMDLNINKDFLNNYLANDISTTTEESGYLFDVALQIKFTSIPDKIKLMGLLDGNARTQSAHSLELSEYTGMTLLDKTKMVEYVISGGYLVNNKIDYETQLYIDDSNVEGTSIDEFATALQKIINIKAITFNEFIDFRDSDEKNVFGLTIMDLDDFNDFVEFQANGTGEVTDSGDVKEITYDVIPVPNTALDFSKLLYIIGYVLLMGGAYLLLRYKVKKGNN